MNDPLYMLATTGYELWRSHVVGNQCPANHGRYERMKEPKIDDLVLETSSTPRIIRGFQTDWHKPEHCLGYFVRKTYEPVPDWNEIEQGEPAPKELVWYIRAFDGRELRWVNANFITIVPAEGWK